MKKNGVWLLVGLMAFSVGSQRTMAGNPGPEAIPGIVKSQSTVLAQLQGIRQEMQNEANLILGRAVRYSGATAVCITVPIVGWAVGGIFTPLQKANACDRMHREIRRKIRKMDQAIAFMEEVVHLSVRRVHEGSLSYAATQTLAEINSYGESNGELMGWIMKANRAGMTTVLSANPPVAYTNPSYQQQGTVYPDYFGLLKSFLIQYRETLKSLDPISQNVEGVLVQGGKI